MISVLHTTCIQLLSAILEILKELFIISHSFILIKFKVKHLEKTEMLFCEQIIDKLVVLLSFCGLFSYWKLRRNREEGEKKKKGQTNPIFKIISKQARINLPKPHLGCAQLYSNTRKLKKMYMSKWKKWSCPCCYLARYVTVL